MGGWRSIIFTWMHGESQISWEKALLGCGVSPEVYLGMSRLGALRVIDLHACPGNGQIGFKIGPGDGRLRILEVWTKMRLKCRSTLFRVGGRGKGGGEAARWD